MKITIPQVSDKARQAFKLNTEEQIVKMGQMLLTKVGAKVAVMHFGEMCEGIVQEVTQDDYCFIIRTTLNRPALSDWDGNTSTKNCHMINKLDNRGLSTINFL